MKLWRVVRRRRAAFVIVALVAAAVMLTAVIVNRLRPAVVQSVGVEPDPDAALHEIQNDLAAGKPRTLVGEKGPPHWFRRVHRGGEVSEPDLNDGVWAIQAQDQRAAFIELLPDPVVERYRFSAEVRQDKPELAGVGRIGVYFGRYTYETSSAYPPFHALRLEFQDENQSQPGEPPNSRLAIMALLVVAPPGSQVKSPAVGCGGHDFSPATRFPGPWRKLVIEVHPDKVLASWWNENTKTLEPVGKGLNANGLTSVTRSLQQEADKLKDLPSTPRTIEAFQPRSGLGLYAFRSKASFRNVVIEPLPPDQ
jgi:hypothetical protein